MYLDGKVLLVYGLFALLLARLGVRAPIPYVQDAILNLHHPYIIVTTYIKGITLQRVLPGAR